jgi:hypothetical protein
MTEKVVEQIASGALLVISIYNIILALWGLGIMDSDCQSLSLFSRLQWFLSLSCGFSTLYITIILCNKYCTFESLDTKNMWRPNILLAIVGFIYSIVIVVFCSVIKNDIDDCAQNTSNYKTALFAGIVSNGVAVAVCFLSIVMFFTEKIKKGPLTREEIQRQESDKLKSQVAKQKQRQAMEQEQRKTTETYNKILGYQIQYQNLLDELETLNKGWDVKGITSDIENVKERIAVLNKMSSDYIFGGKIENNYAICTKNRQNCDERVIFDPSSANAILASARYKKQEEARNLQQRLGNNDRKEMAGQDRLRRDFPEFEEERKEPIVIQPRVNLNRTDPIIIQNQQPVNPNEPEVQPRLRLDLPNQNEQLPPWRREPNPNNANANPNNANANPNNANANNDMFRNIFGDDD